MICLEKIMLGQVNRHGCVTTKASVLERNTVDLDIMYFLQPITVNAVCWERYLRSFRRLLRGPQTLSMEDPYFSVCLVTSVRLLRSKPQPRLTLRVQPQKLSS